MTPEETNQLKPGDVLEYVWAEDVGIALAVVLGRTADDTIRVECIYDPDPDRNRVGMRWLIYTPEYYTLFYKATDDQG